MSVLAEFLVPASGFVLADTLTAASGMRIEIQRVVSGSDRVTPYFWATGGDFEVFEQALRDDSTIQDVLTLEEHQDDERFYRVTWQTTEPSLIAGISDSKGAILEAVSDDSEKWKLTVLFPSRDSLSEFHDYCTENGFQFTLERVYRAENPQENVAYGVTDEQQEALEAAYRAGYFKVPRDTSLTELTDELGVSRNALSARLRRGLHNLLAHTLIHEE